MAEKPTGVTANKSKREFTVTWDSGHTSVYPFGLLRAACPCAQCRGGHENMKSEPDAEVFTRQMEDTLLHTHLEHCGDRLLCVDHRLGRRA